MKKVILLAPEEICDTLRNALEHKYTTLPCSDCSAAKELLLSEPDILIISLVLPGGNVLTFLKENRPILPSKIIALTVYFDNAILWELASLGINHIIRIPCPLSYLEQTL